ncbi:polyketide cyclase [Mycolicibacterium murale]|uniref:Polyketide cyclase n=1 Tax=Mycolicibacterium murale TaxID=182220 RepID=A0A7I9WGQ7_9MYCO|nr:nuclear transport factor 2 family protein [Mycolicibacterium murale]MCV7182938.1 nuclear transport factor 2 family protein [Mycolicibacterium murale]GFG56490.1 polyketide cyclase [Mycolicibacterium murale]
MSDISKSDTPDRAAILDLISAYAFGLDRRDFARVASTFTEEAVVENLFDEYLPEGKLFNSLTIGGTAVADGARDLFGTLDATQHQLGAQIVEMTGTGARASTQVVARHHRGVQFFKTGATYEDEFVRTPDGWRIAKRTQHIHWTAGSPDVFIAQ